MSPSPVNDVIRLPKLGLIGNLVVSYKETEDGEIPILFRPRSSPHVRKPITCCIARSYVKSEDRMIIRRWNKRRSSAFHPPNPNYAAPPVKRIRIPDLPVSRIPTTPTKASSGGEPAQPEEEAVNPDLMDLIRNMNDRLMGFAREVREQQDRNIFDNPEQVKKCMRLASWQMGNALIREFHGILQQELLGESAAREILMRICTERSVSSAERRKCLRSNKELLVRELAASEARLERFKEIAEATRMRGKLAMRMLLGNEG